MKKVLLSSLLAAFATTAVANTSPDVTYEYDVRGQLVKVVQSDGEGIAYFYDAAGNRTAVVQDDASSLPDTPPGITGPGCIVVIPIASGVVIPC